MQTMVDSMDQGIGKIIESLKQNGQLENTLILYMQDNGGCQEAYGRQITGPRNERKEKAKLWAKMNSNTT